MATYAKSGAGVLRQGEILTDFTQYQLDVEKLREDIAEAIPIPHTHVVVLSQDCDLENDHLRRAKGKTDNLLASVLFCAAAPNTKEFRRGIGLGTEEWKKVQENRDPRLQYIRAVPPEDDAHNEGLPDLVIDFRQYFALPTEEAYFAAGKARRRCRLDTPYAEHLSQRFAAYMGRVALPLNHHDALPTTTAAAGATAATSPSTAGNGAGADAGASAGGNGDGAAQAPSAAMAMHPSPVTNLASTPTSAPDPGKGGQ